MRVDGPESVTVQDLKVGVKAANTDWSSYSAAYDLLAEHNPAYQDLLKGFESFLASIDAPQSICDLGGGTGNFAEIAARLCPGSTIHFVEPDAGMNRMAQAKLADHADVIYHTSTFEQVKAPEPVDLVVCVHALYTMPDPLDRLKEMRRLLKPGGILYLVDLGRHLNLADWRSYLFTHLKGKHGLVGALRIFWQAREIARQNANILAAQQNGEYWVHSPEDFVAAVADAGFDIIRQDTVYRGYSDLVVCRPRS